MKSEQRQLQKHFKKEQIKFQILENDVDATGKPFVLVAPYIPGMIIIEFLDNFLGANRWQNKLGTHGKLRGLSIKIDGIFVTKYNISPVIADELPGAKEWGIGRYLNNVEPIFAECSFEKKRTTIKFAAAIQDKIFTGNILTYQSSIRSVILFQKKI